MLLIFQMSDNAGLSARQEEIPSAQLTSLWLSMESVFTLCSINYLPYRFSNER